MRILRLETILVIGLAIEIIIRSYAFAFLLLLFICFLFYRSHTLAKKFHCKRCGQCCRLLVRLNVRDIKRLNKAGKSDFLDGKYLKRVNGYCKLLTLKNGTAKCSVYNSRPEVCRRWPVFDSFLGKHSDLRCSQFLKI